MWSFGKRASVFLKSTKHWNQIKRYCTNKRNISNNIQQQQNPSLVIGISAYLTSLSIILTAENVYYILLKQSKADYRLKKLNTEKQQDIDDIRTEEITKEIQNLKANPYLSENSSGSNYIPLFLRSFPRALKDDNIYLLLAYPIFPAVIASLTSRRLLSSKRLFHQFFNNTNPRKTKITNQALKKAAIMTIATTSASVFGAIVLIQASAYWDNRHADKVKDLVETDVDLVRRIGGFMTTAAFLFFPGMIFVSPTYVISFPVAFLVTRRLLLQFIKKTSREIGYKL